MIEFIIGVMEVALGIIVGGMVFVAVCCNPRFLRWYMKKTSNVVTGMF